MKQTINIRFMGEADLASVVHLENAYFDQPSTGKRLKYELYENEMAYFFVAEIDVLVVGYVGFWITGINADVMNIVVDKTVRGQGVGRLLLTKMIDFCKDRQLENISLEVREGNRVAIELYERLGFKLVRKRKNYYPDGEDAFYMVMQLGGK